VLAFLRAILFLARIARACFSSFSVFFSRVCESFTIRDSKKTSAHYIAQALSRTTVKIIETMIEPAIPRPFEKKKSIYALQSPKQFKKINAGISPRVLLFTGLSMIVDRALSQHRQSVVGIHLLLQSDIKETGRFIHTQFFGPTL